jgi:hypothetical protein
VPKFASLRTRTTKTLIDGLRARVVNDFRFTRISRRRCDLLLAILDAFEREAHVPAEVAKAEVKQESAYEKSLTGESPRGKVG